MEFLRVVDDSFVITSDTAWFTVSRVGTLAYTLAPQVFGQTYVSEDDFLDALAKMEQNQAFLGRGSYLKAQKETKLAGRTACVLPGSQESVHRPQAELVHAFSEQNAAHVTLGQLQRVLGLPSSGSIFDFKFAPALYAQAELSHCSPNSVHTRR